jgi:EAL domain-containing protein (putative c-di-GMP-specific phosphodiesterase class I)
MNAYPAFVEQTHIISINLSGHSLTNKKFLDSLIAQFGEFKIDASKICFEITETAAISNLSMATSFISRLKELGCHFALDDFGSGLSSFAYLKSLPVDYLKIDGMFVKDMVDDPIDHAMVKSINEIGHVMGVKTIAEFVENDAIKVKLSEIGVDYAQGYGIKKPQPFIEILESSNH